MRRVSSFVCLKLYVRIDFSRICPHGPAARTLLTLPWNPFDPRFSRSPSAGMFFESTSTHKHAIAATREGSSRTRAPGRRGVRGESSRWNPPVRGPGGSQGSLRVGTRHGQSAIPHARPLPSVHTYKQGPLRSIALDHDLPKISIQSSLGSTKHRRMRRKRLSDPRPIPERVRGPICPRKK